MKLLDAVRERLGRRANSDGVDPDRREGSTESSADPGRGPSDALVAYADRWEESDRGMGKYVVYPPADGPTSIRRCHSLAEVRRRLDQWYGDDALDGGDGE